MPHLISIFIVTVKEKVHLSCLYNHFIKSWCFPKLRSSFEITNKVAEHKIIINCVCAQGHGGGGKHACGGWRTTSSVVPQEQNFLVFFWNRASHLVWSLLSGLGWLTRHLLVSTSPVRQLQVCTTMGDFFMWGQASHSEPCACQISALLVALFP